MAIPLCNTQPRLLSSLPLPHRRPLLSNPRRNLHFTSSPKVRLSLSHSLYWSDSRRRLSRPPPKSASINGYSVHDGAEEFVESRGEAEVDFSERLRRWMAFVRIILPGGSWWSFSEDVEVRILAEPVTVSRALVRMWKLVANDRWVIFFAFSTLIVAALSEISIPHFLTASIFTAQSGEIAVFRRNVKRMRETLYSALLRQDISFFDNETVGDLTSRLGADCQQVSRVIGNDLNLIFRNLLQGSGAMIYLLILSWPLGLCTLMICSTLGAVMLLYGRFLKGCLVVDRSKDNHLIEASCEDCMLVVVVCLRYREKLRRYIKKRRYQKKAAKLTQEFTASANEVAQETFSLMRTVRVYGTEQEELGRYKQWLGRLADISLRQSAAYGFWNLSFNTLYHSTQVIAVLVGGMSILAGHITAEQLTKFILYSEWLIYSTCNDPMFDKVPVLQRVSISVNPNEVIAIVGLSGSGKSTLVNLLLRLYEPTSGEILIDGLSLREFDVMWWRERIGYVGQEPKLFRMDISSNIRYGCTRKVRQEDIEWAAKQAYAHDFISALPNGYNTLVDDDLLSGGQKQRIAIARAILRDPTVLILDEATSALDAESEHNVKGVLRAVRSDKKSKRTVLVIAHRLSTIQAADRIVVMDSGKVVETGSQKELLHKDGLYARLTRKQVDVVA
ncbi:hypothetical protein TIFTF001_010766 [Ficus carica]|uniref:ABC transporter B family member 26, chloroplastic n=1 Tax=Ficus carica TaxID=3494 RepID=A0AA88AK64_FICCA|nr:hypothetical protein TIFTF001_010766 [Ficus carica]